MNEKMTTALRQETGHVLAPLTRAADPEAGTTPAAMTDGSLSSATSATRRESWTPNARFFVPADDLDAKTVDFDADVLANPRAFFLDADKHASAARSSKSVSNALRPPALRPDQLTSSAGRHLTPDTPGVAPHHERRSGGDADAFGRNRGRRFRRHHQHRRVDLGHLLRVGARRGAATESFTFNVP